MQLLNQQGRGFSDAKIAATFWDKLKGLIGRKSLGENECLYITKCSSIHCFWMRMVIDVAYLDDAGRVLLIETVIPWHLGSRVKGAVSVCEAAKGAFARHGIRVGDVLTMAVVSSRANEELAYVA